MITPTLPTSDLFSSFWAWSLLTLCCLDSGSSRYSLSSPVLGGWGLHWWGGGGPFAVWVQCRVRHPRPNRGRSSIRRARWTHWSALMGHPGPRGHAWTLWGQKRQVWEKGLSMNYQCMDGCYLNISIMHACYSKTLERKGTYTRHTV